jgi:hypothetical protein
MSSPLTGCLECIYHLHELPWGREVLAILGGGNWGNCWTGPVEVRENYGFSGREIARIDSVLTAHLKKLCEAWEEIHGGS